jgi:hypothetical protein
LMHATWRQFGAPATAVRFQSQPLTPRWRIIRPSPESIHADTIKTYRATLAVRRLIPTIDALNDRERRKASRDKSAKPASDPSQVPLDHIRIPIPLPPHRSSRA